MFQDQIESSAAVSPDRPLLHRRRAARIRRIHAVTPCRRRTEQRRSSRLYTAVNFVCLATWMAGGNTARRGPPRRPGLNLACRALLDDHVVPQGPLGFTRDT